MHRQRRTAKPAGLPDANVRCWAGTVLETPGWNFRQSRAALAMLLEAFGYAEELDRSPWDFAVEIAALNQAGLTSSALRWLVCKSYVEHACETTSQSHAARSFRRRKGLRFGRQTCFVLTRAGLAFARDVLARSLSADSQDGVSPERPGDEVDGALRPIWDRQRRQLRVGPVVVKQFKVPASNQEAILAALEEEGWPIRIDDPLAPHPEQSPKRRLHDTINSLNRNQRHPLLRFMGDGSGEGVRWTFSASSGGNNAEVDPRP